MEFIYTIDPNAEEPIMLIDKHIGIDQEEGEGIMGDKFSRELMLLDTLNKSKIHIWINSPGGVVTDGMQIMATILKTKTKVDTHNLGIAASIALPIWLSGRKRFMMDYAKGMMHPVSGGDDKTRMALEDSVVTMLTARSGITPELIVELMNKTTWIKASEFKAMGVCEVENSNDLNKQRVSSNDWKDYKFITNKLIEEKKLKPIYMKDVANKLGLNDQANESSIVSEIAKLQNKIEDSAKFLDKAKKDMEDAENKYKDLQDKFNKLEASEKEAKETKDRLEAKASENKAKELITNAVKIGKIKNDLKLIENWEKQATANFDSTKELIDSIAVSKNGAKLSDITNNGNEAVEADLTNVIAMEMAEVRNRLKL